MTLRIHLVLEVTIPQHSSLFQALVLAFWRFQGLAATTLFSAVLQAIQDRAKAELESIWSRILLRLKKIGRRWSKEGALAMLAACLVYALRPDRYAELEAALRGEHHPQVSLLITSLKAIWVT